LPIIPLIGGGSFGKLPMTAATPKPNTKPVTPHFSCGPAAKRPGWSLDALQGVCSGRSHRSKLAKEKLQQVSDLSRSILGIPDDYKIAIVAASDTGAVEMALWSLLGPRGVDVFAWEAFGRDWVTDVLEELKIEDSRSFIGDYGKLPDFSEARPDRDIVFTWNGTAGGARVVNTDWISDSRDGLVICDATSAVFAMEVPWQKLDVVTWSWQKVMGGEAQHGMLVMSPRAMERLKTWNPPWPIPKVYRMARKGKISEGIFKNEPINTPSMLCVEDAIDSLNWMKSIGGAPAIVRRTRANYQLLEDWVRQTPWVDFLCTEDAIRSPTSVCLRFTDPAIAALDQAGQTDFMKAMVALLEKEGAGYDIAAYRDAPPGLRIWVGGTVEASDVKALLPWLDWAFATTKADLKLAA
jgi:phosphoserine aminotransferase